MTNLYIDGAFDARGPLKSTADPKESHIRLGLTSDDFHAGWESSGR